MEAITSPDRLFRLWRLFVLLSTTAFILAFRITAFSQSDNNIVATVNGRTITQSEVDNLAISQTLALEQKLFAIRKAVLENLITKSVLETEARKRGLAVSDLRKELTAGEIRVTTTEVEDAYDANANFFGNMSPDEAKERLRLDLENQARMQNFRNGLAKLKERANIIRHFSEPTHKTLGEHERAPVMGPGDAPVTLLAFSDFECVYCRSAQNTLKQLMAWSENKIRLVFKHFPLEIHQHAFPAAQAAYCAGEQNKFWQYHDALFAAAPLTSESFNQIAKNLDLRMAEFTRCMRSSSSRNAVLLDVREAAQLGINSTPTYVINGKVVNGALGLEELKTLVEEELRSSPTLRNRKE